MQMTSMHFNRACENGHIEVVKLLLSDEVTNKFGRIDIHANNESAFRWHVKMGRESTDFRMHKS